MTSILSVYEGGVCEAYWKSECQSLVWLPSLSLASLNLSYELWIVRLSDRHNMREGESHYISTCLLSRKEKRGRCLSSREPAFIMESVVRLKKSLRTPIRKLTSCVSGVKERRWSAKHRRKKCRGRGGQRRCNMLGCTPPLRAAHPQASSVIRSYQKDLEKERQVDTESCGERSGLPTDTTCSLWKSEKNWWRPQTRPVFEHQTDFLSLKLSEFTTSVLIIYSFVREQVEFCELSFTRKRNPFKCNSAADRT